MGGQHTKEEEEGIKVRSRIRGNSIFMNFEAENVHNIPKQPSDTAVNLAFEAMLTQLVLGSEQKRILLQQSPQIKWTLINQYTNFMEKNSERIKKASKSFTKTVILRLKKDTSKRNLNLFKNWLESEDATEDDIAATILFDGVSILLQILNGLERKSKLKEDIEKENEILRCLKKITQFNEGAASFAKSQNDTYTLVSKLNFERPENVQLILQILQTISTYSVQGLETTLNAFSRFALALNLKYRFDYFLNYLKNPKDFFVVKYILEFIRDVAELIPNDQAKSLFRVEILNHGILPIITDLKQLFTIDESSQEYQGRMTLDLIPNDKKKPSKKSLIRDFGMRKSETIQNYNNIDEEAQNIYENILEVLNNLEKLYEGLYSESLEIGGWVSTKNTKNTEIDTQLKALQAKVNEESLKTPFLDMLHHINVASTPQEFRFKFWKLITKFSKTAFLSFNKDLQEKIEVLEQNLEAREEEIRILTKEKNELEHKIQNFRKSSIQVQLGPDQENPSSNQPPPAPLVQEIVPVPAPPPPPPAPPIMKQSIPAPPPAPLIIKSGMKQQIMKTKEKQKPSVAMKNVMWNMIPQGKIQNCIWEQIEEDQVTLDKQYLEQEFSQKIQKQQRETMQIYNSNTSENEQKQQQQQQTRVSLLPKERIQNLEIILGRLKMSSTLIINSIFKCDQQIINLQLLNSLSEIAPNENEIQLLKGYDGQKSELALPDKFLLDLSVIPQYLHRVNTLKFSLTYTELLQDLNNKIQNLQKFFENLKNDKRIHLTLKYALALGNYLNGISARGGAYGFKLDSIERFQDVKASDGKHTLMMYLLEKIEKENQIKIELNNEETLCLDIACKVPIQQISTDLGEIRLYSKDVEIAIKSQTERTEDLITEKFNQFSQEIQIKIEEKAKEIFNIEQYYNDVCIFFCEDPKELNSDKFAAKIHKFWQICKTTKRNQESLEKAEQMQKILEQNKIAKSQTLKSDKFDSNSQLLTTNNNNNINNNNILTDQQQQQQGKLDAIRMQLHQKFIQDKINKNNRESFSNPENIKQLESMLIQGTIRKEDDQEEI